MWTISIQFHGGENKAYNLRPLHYEQRCQSRA